MTTFTELKLSAPLLQALATEGYETPTPIQSQAIPPLLEGRDLLGIAQTGTGKTAAFALPLLQRLTSTDRRAGPRSVRALILTPTRELCIQILDSFRTYGRHLRLSRVAVYGGVSQGPQVHNLSRGLDVLVATPPQPWSSSVRQRSRQAPRNRQRGHPPSSTSPSRSWPWWLPRC